MSLRAALLVPSGLDPGIAPFVRVLREHGVETFESCQGGDGHSYAEPTVRFHGQPEEGFRALAVALEHGFPVEAIRRSSDGAPVTPRGVRIAVLLALRATLVDVPHPVRERGHIGGVYRHVLPQARYGGLEGGGYAVETVRERVGVRSQLDGEAVTGPDARGAAESALQAGMVLDERGNPRPRRQAVESS